MSKLAATIISGLLTIGGPTVLFAQTSGEQGPWNIRNPKTGSALRLLRQFASSA